MQQASIESLREDYKKNSLDEKDLREDPFLQFEQWFEEARNAGIYEPNAMNLATADITGRPSSRIVLLKGFNATGFIFYTNYSSKKGQQLLENPWAALNFFWPELERQVRIEGKIVMTSAEESSAYFSKRPKGSQIGAIVSPQSQVITNRSGLEMQWKELDKTSALTELTRPGNWGGYRLIPELVEFWQGRSSRLHDRLQYTLKDGKTWKIGRLAP